MISLVLAVLVLGQTVNQSASAAESRYGATAPKLAEQQSSVGGPTPTTVAEMWSAWCARCHADDGSGKVKEPTITVEPMDFTECKVTTPEPDADWARAIAKGGPGVGLSPEMPGFEDSLTREQISGFVKHMRGFCKEARWPSGNANFPRPIITEKAFPENEFLLLPVVSHATEPSSASATDVGLVAVYERRIGRRAMYEVGIPFYNWDFQTSRASAIGDLAVAIKYAAYASTTTPRIVSFGLEATLPTGELYKGFGKGTVVFEPFIAAGTMVGDWYVQAHGKVELPVDTLVDRAYLYNVYVGRDTSAAPNTWTLGVELNGENRELWVTPQIRKGLTGTGALAASLGASIPVKYRGERVVSWVGYLLWEFLEPLRARR
ncbi:MAG: cytochrome c [Acidobacteria bacterium]|nr:cytochrome c [Acidobacteriota bacterium]MSO60832.1 cytochrome c [Acidobacteriota bacterium]